MSNNEAEPTMQDPFAGLQPPVEYTYVPLTEDNGPALERARLEEGLLGTEWMVSLYVAAERVAECDLADRQGVKELEHRLLHADQTGLAIDQLTADNVHSIFGEAYGNQRTHVDPASPDAEVGSVSGLIRLFRLPNGRVLLTSTNYEPISDEMLDELRAARHAPLNAKLLDRAQQGSSVSLDEASHPDHALTADQVQSRMPDLDHFEENGRGSTLTALLAEDAGITRVLDGKGKLGVCHWYLVRDGRDTDAQEMAAGYFNVA